MNRVHASLASADLQFGQPTPERQLLPKRSLSSTRLRGLCSPGSGAPPESVAESDFLRARAYMIRGDFDLAGPLAEA